MLRSNREYSMALDEIDTDANEVPRFVHEHLHNLADEY